MSSCCLFRSNVSACRRRRSSTITPFCFTVNVFPNFRSDARSEPVDCTVLRPCFLYFDTRYDWRRHVQGGQPWFYGVANRSRLDTKTFCLYLNSFRVCDPKVERFILFFFFFVLGVQSRSRKINFVFVNVSESSKVFFFFRKQIVSTTMVSRRAVWKNPNHWSSYEELGRVYATRSFGA